MSRYKVNRIGFVNFWLYDEEDFYFYDGKLLLRGTNGSGKTVTMQSFFPLIFDGNKSPERLDPFGSRDRKIEDYLISEDFTGNENTGYLYIEFYNEDQNHYLTIGIGLRAIKNRNCEFWGFAITDNRRIGTDFLLFRERNLRIPLSKKELQGRIGSGGEFAETAKAYKKMVNKLLFGFPSVDLYSEFINLLIQVRSPKLSNSTRPSQLTKILSTVLEPLSEEDLRIMADSFDDINKYKEKLADLQNEQKACSNLKIAYQEYNQFILYHKGESFLKYRQEQNNLQKEIKEKQSKYNELLNSIKVEMDCVKNLKLELQELEHRKSKLEETDLKSISNQLEEIIQFIKELEMDQKNKEGELDQKEEILHKNKRDLKIKQDELEQVKKSFDEFITDLIDCEESIYFDDAKNYLDEVKKNGLEFSQMPSYLDLIKKRLQLLTHLQDIAYKIYQKEREIESEKNEYELHNDQLKKIEKERVAVSQELLEYLDEFKNGIAKTSEENHILKLDQAILDRIYEFIDSLNRDMFIQIKDIIKNKSYELKDEIQMRISKNKIKINEYHTKVDQLNVEVQQIDHILIEHLDDSETKEYFKNNTILFDYFFNVIQFKDHVSESIRKKVESFLFQTGILTSFVTNMDHPCSNVKAKCLKPGEEVSYNLTMYLDALDTPFKEKVLKILKSISIHDDHVIKILEHGNYELAIIEGTVDGSHELRYIGADVRFQYIQKEKEKITIAISQLSKEIMNLETDNVEFDKQIEVLDLEFSHFIFPNKINQYFERLSKLDLDLQFLNENMVKLVDTLKIKTRELRDIEEEFETNKNGYQGSSQYSDITVLLKNTNRYFEVVNQLSICLNDYRSKNEFVNYYNEIIQNLNDDLDNMKYELQQMTFKLDGFYRKKQTIDNILNSDKYKDIGQEYKNITQRLSIIKEEIPMKDNNITRNQVNSEHLVQDIERLTIQFNDTEVFKNVAYKIFMDEYQLHYVDSKELSDQELYHFIHSLKPRNTGRDIYEKFNDSLNKYSQYLIHYVPKNINIHLVEDREYLNFTNDESKKDTICNMFESAIRRDVIFNYLGKSVNLLELSISIDTSIASYQTLIDEEDKKLFEDLLINNIGSSIRNKIHQSEEWIHTVKQEMESMQTSSGLSFSLKWLSIAPQTEEEIDSKEIVSIFKKEAQNLKPEHLNQITNHFKSKIKMKEEVLEESERNYLEIIKEVLDYRKWFEFKLYFKRGNNDKKELTDREFNKMSGGEKAIAMYIPLFSSIYAKLSSAHQTAPRVIALDEAFAGVDDDNIKDAFRMLAQLDIDYVLTSQQLWGDYETVKHLAISELHHPVGSKVVSIVKYKWDGKVRTKIDDTNEYQK